MTNTSNRSQPLECWGIRLPMSSTRSTRVDVRVWRHLFPPSSLRRPCVHRRTARRLPAPARRGAADPTFPPTQPASAAPARHLPVPPPRRRCCSTPAPVSGCRGRGTGDSGRDKATDDGDCIRVTISESLYPLIKSSVLTVTKRVEDTTLLIERRTLNITQNRSCQSQYFILIPQTRTGPGPSPTDIRRFDAESVPSLCYSLSVMNLTRSVRVTQALPRW